MAGILIVQIKSLQEKNINFRKVEHFIKRNSNKNLDLVVLPEYFATNMDFTKSETTENSETLEFLKNLAIKYRTNIIASSIVKENEKSYNRLFAINRNGDIVQTYDKIHLNNYFGNVEGESLTAGDKTAIAEFDFARVGLALGFDIRFPNHFTKLIKENVDIIVLPIAWFIPKEVYENREALKTAKDMWISICKTRAYDNGVYFVISNQTKEGLDNNYGLGNSMIIAPTSQILAHIDEKDDAAFVDIDIQYSKYMHQLFPIANLS